MAKNKNIFEKFFNVIAGIFIEAAIETTHMLFGKNESFFSRMSTLTMVGASIVTLIALIQSGLAHKENPTFEQKIIKLKDTEQSLQELMTFVQDQQKQLADSKAVVDRLKSEQEKLQPMVESDRKVVDAVLAAQAERQSVNVWMERGIGFIIGTFASLLATLIWTFLVNLQRNRTTSVTPG